MADELAYVGEMTIGACIPGPVAAINVALPSLQAQVAGLLAFNPIPTVSFSADIGLATNIITNLNTSIALGISPPSISAQLAIVAGLLSGLQAQLSAVLGIVDLFARAGVHVYAYSGTPAGFGATLTSALSGGFPGSAAGSCNAIVLATTTSLTWAGMQTVFKTSA